VEIMPFNETVTVHSGDREAVLGLAVARMLWVSAE